MLYVYATLLLALNLVFWASILFNLPGTWLMVLTAVLVEWLGPDNDLVTPGVLYWVTGLALLGELLEFLLGAAGSRKAGGSKRAAGLAIVGGIVGAIVGTGIPIPIMGTLLGACIGAFAGSVVGDRWAGRPIGVSVEAGRGAAIGRLWGTIAKMTVGGLIVGILTYSAFVG